MKIVKSSLITLLAVVWIAPLHACSNEKGTAKNQTERVMSKEQLKTDTNQSKPSKQSADEVRALQTKLSEDGYYNGPIDGVMSPELRKAAKGALQDRI